MQVCIRRARTNDSEILTEISFASKRYWNYPEEYYEIWRDELTITQSYVDENIVYVALRDDKILGYFSIVEVKETFWVNEIEVLKGFWLEHIFIEPDYIGKGIGTKLIELAKVICKERGIEKVFIFSDPNSRGFYDEIGARYIQESPSSIKGRTVSLYELGI